MTAINSAEQFVKKHISVLIKLWRGSDSGQALSKKETTAVATALLGLQRGLTGERTLAGAGYMDNQSYRGAYMLYYWPVSYMQTFCAASYSAAALRTAVAESAQAPRPVRMLDVGSGPGPASAALIDFLQSAAGCTAVDVSLVDGSEKALSTAEHFFAAEKSAVSVQTACVDLENEREVNKYLDAAAPYDVIVMGHALNELWSGAPDAEEKRCALLKQIAEKLTARGVLIVMEPALLATSRSLLSVRTKLTLCGYAVAAPCCVSASCPALTAGSAQTCHAEISWQPVEPVCSLAQGAGLDRESVKMTFFAFVHAPVQQQKNDDAKKTDQITARVVSEPMLNKAGRIRYVLCSGTERFTVSAKKEDPHAAAIGFFSLHRYDLVRITGAELRGDIHANKYVPTYGIAPLTQLSVERQC